MTTGRNPILIGQAEELDLVLPQVRAMMANEGVYIGGDTAHPAFTIPLVSYRGKILSLVTATELDPERFIPTFTVHGPYLASTHPDDFAVDRFAAAMKAKMASKRAEGRSGWDDKTACSAERLQTLLVDHLTKGDPVDVGNFAMMLFNRGEWCTAPTPAQAEVPSQHAGARMGTEEGGEAYTYGYFDGEAAGYARRRKEDWRDAERYRLLRRGQKWSVINGTGDDLRADALDAAIDAALRGEVES